MLANRLRPIDQPVVANNCCPQRALDAIQPLFLFVLWQEMPTAQCGKGIASETSLIEAIEYAERLAIARAHQFRQPKTHP